ncbi:MAG: restriction endonuclease [Limisphaerales bacterium]
MYSFPDSPHATLRALGSVQLRNLVASAFRRQGNEVRPVRRPDPLAGEIDLILRRNGGSVAVRCSPGLEPPVGVLLLRRFARARDAAGTAQGVMVSVAGFTDEAHDLAPAHRIRPWSVPEVVRLLEDTSTLSDPAALRWILDRRTICAVCEAEMPHGKPRCGSPSSVDGQCHPCPEFARCALVRGLQREHERLGRLWPEGSTPVSHSLGPAGNPMHRIPAPLPMKLVICSREAARAPTRFQPTHVVSIVDPGSDVLGLRPSGIPPENHHIGVFCDIRDPASPEAPAESSVRSVISWLEPRCQPDSNHHFLVHCQAGVGRSPAVGYVAWAIHLGPGREQEAWDRMLDSCVKRWVAPNSLVIRHADRLLGRDGALCDPLQRWSLPLPWSRFL